MNTSPRLALVIGSTRPQRFADKPAEWLLKQAAERQDFVLETLDLRDFDLPFFAEAGSNLHVPSADARAVAWQQALSNYDGFVFLVAEYNRSITAALKNALDQAGVEWVRKPFAAFGYGSVGAANAIQHLRHVGIELQMVPSKFSAYLSGSDLFKVHPFGLNGPISDVEAGIKPSVDAMFDDLVWWANTLRAARPAAE
ncbi:NAD(P)H-dependent oxidoreductase [Streptomyces sp. NPDC007084]|uniref:NADPH-dependent FMN reductase n=1 Tax=Streptomyces sp. NPDC007084 TaxID=3154313 RepID=UPI003451FE3D